MTRRQPSSSGTRIDERQRTPRQQTGGTVLEQAAHRLVLRNGGDQAEAHRHQDGRGRSRDRRVAGQRVEQVGPEDVAGQRQRADAGDGDPDSRDEPAQARAAELQQEPRSGERPRHAPPAAPSGPGPAWPDGPRSGRRAAARRCRGRGRRHARTAWPRRSGRRAHRARRPVVPARARAAGALRRRRSPRPRCWAGSRCRGRPTPSAGAGPRPSRGARSRPRASHSRPGRRARAPRRRTRNHYVASARCARSRAASRGRPSRSSAMRPTRPDRSRQAPAIGHRPRSPPPARAGQWAALRTSTRTLFRPKRFASASLAR